MKKKIKHAVVISYDPILGLKGRAWGGEIAKAGELIISTKPDKYPLTFIGFIRINRARIKRWFSCTLHWCKIK
jgi:hypothetical protein